MSRGGGDKQVAKNVGRLEGKLSEHATSLTSREGERRGKEGGRSEEGEEGERGTTANFQASRQR